MIAAKAEVSVRALRELNHLSSSHLRLGQVLRLPDSSKRVADNSGQSTATNSKRAHQAVYSHSAVHLVASGDNLWDIARHYHVSAEALAQANGLTARTVLKLGQKLRVPGAAATRAQAAGILLADNTDALRYQVQEGDSLWTISRRFKVSVDALKKWNRLPTSTAALQPGQRLLVNGET